MKNIIAKKTFNFGKIAYISNRRTCAAEVTMEYRDTESGKELSISGAIWNNLHTNCYSCGQNLDEMKKYLFHDKNFMRLYGLWKNWHLNGLNSGTAKQEAAIEEWRKRNGGSFEYKAACDYLKSIGLYVDTLADNEVLSVETPLANRNHYEYGHGWIMRLIPVDVEAEIYNLLGYEPKQAAA